MIFSSNFFLTKLVIYIYSLSIKFSLRIYSVIHVHKSLVSFSYLQILFEVVHVLEAERSIFETTLDSVSVYLYATDGNETTHHIHHGKTPLAISCFAETCPKEALVYTEINLAKK